MIQVIKKRKGTSLAEVLVAVFILALVVSGLFGMLMQGFKAIETAQDYTRVSQILRTRWNSFAPLIGRL